MKVLLRRPVATQSSGSDGLTAAEDGDGDGGNGDEDTAPGGGEGQWGVAMERGVWDEPIIKRWEDAKVCTPSPSLSLRPCAMLLDRNLVVECRSAVLFLLQLLLLPLRLLLSLLSMLLFAIDL